MATESSSPFGIPGLGQAFGTAGNNPLVASLEMIRHAMTGMTGGAGKASDPLAPALTPEDLERRINDLKVVENWLKLNLSMLTSSIQGLEVQLATIQTLRSFVAMGGQPTGRPSGGPSPLEVVLGLKPDPGGAKQAGQASRAASDAATPKVSPPDPVDPGAAQAWWKMLEHQFSQLAAATAAATQPMTTGAKATTPKKVVKQATRRPRKKTTPAAD